MVLLRESELVNSVGPTEETKHEDTIEQINQQKHRKLNYSALKRVHKTRIIPELREEDLEESFVRGMSSPEVDTRQAF